MQNIASSQPEQARRVVCICGHDRLGYTLKDGVLTRWLTTPTEETPWLLHEDIVMYHAADLQEVRVHCMWDGMEFQMNYIMFYLYAAPQSHPAGNFMGLSVPYWRPVQTDIRQLPLELGS